MRFPAALAMLAAVALAASAQNPWVAPEPARVRGESPQTRTRVAEAERAILDGKPADVAELLKLLDEAGDDLISADGKTYVPARRYVFGLLARLPADALRTVRDRTDGPAAKLLEQGKSARDPRPLRLLLDRYFVSRSAEDALLLLGELAFERGEFRSAAGYWRRLLPGTPAADLPFPDPKADPATVRARVALALIFGGELERAASEIAALRAKAPTAAGRLAGKDGPFVATLETLLRNPPRVPPEATPGGDWTAFAGSPERNGAATAPLPRHWPPFPAWRTPILPAAGPPPGRTLPFAASPRACAFHPVVIGDTAYIADPVRVIGFDLRTGATAVGFDLRSEPNGRGLTNLDFALPVAGDADYTLTAADGRLYARLGRPDVAPPADLGAKPGPTSWLVCLAPSEKDGGGEPRRSLGKVWELPPPTTGDAPAAWEAAPVVARGRVFAAVSRFEGNRVVQSVAAYDDPPGRPLWVTDVSESPASGGIQPRRAVPEPLTLADGVLVFCTHAGVIAAVDAATGKPAWAVCYPRATRSPGSAFHPDLCPAVAADGRVFAAPADADAVFALDAATGKTLWSLDGVYVDQLLGVSRGRLVVTLNGPAKGIRGLNVATGAYTDPDGWQTHDDPFLGSFGRGLVSDDFILWPTRSKEGTYVLHAADGTNAAGWQTLRDARGNLAFAGGTLVVATPTEVLGYEAKVPVSVSVPAEEKSQSSVSPLTLTPTLALAPSKPFAPRRPAAAWTPSAASDLAPPVGVTRVPFPTPRCVPLLPFPGETDLPGLGRDVPEANRHLVVADERAIHGYRPEADRPAWSAPLPAGLRPTHAAADGDRLVLAGPHAAATLRLADGVVGPVTSLPEDGPDLSGFVLAGSRLVARLGGHHLVGIDPAAGKVAWVRDGNGRPRFTPYPIATAPAFDPSLGSDGRSVVARLTNGRRWTVDADTGKVTAYEPTALNPWEAVPARADAGLIVSDGPGLVRLIDPTRGTIGWSHDLRWEASQTGRSPVARWVNGSVLAAASRNFGVEIDRLRRDGVGLWSQGGRGAAVLTADAIDLSAADADDRLAYLPTGDRLTAVRWTTGQPEWATELPAGVGPWTVRAGRRALVAYPATAVPFDTSADVLLRAAGRFLSRPTAGRLPAAAAGVYDAWTARTLPVLVLDPGTGAVRQRLELPAVGPVAAVHVGSDAAVAATAGAAYWLK